MIFHLTLSGKNLDRVFARFCIEKKSSMIPGITNGQNQLLPDSVRFTVDGLAVSRFKWATEQCSVSNRQTGHCAGILIGRITPSPLKGGGGGVKPSPPPLWVERPLPVKFLQRPKG